jgi:hypothetical protein
MDKVGRSAQAIARAGASHVGLAGELAEVRRRSLHRGERTTRRRARRLRLDLGRIALARRFGDLFTAPGYRRGRRRSRLSGLGLRGRTGRASTRLRDGWGCRCRGQRWRLSAEEPINLALSSIEFRLLPFGRGWNRPCYFGKRASARLERDQDCRKHGRRERRSTGVRHRGLFSKVDAWIHRFGSRGRGHAAAAGAEDTRRSAK